MQSLKKIHAWAQMKVPLSMYTRHSCPFNVKSRGGGGGGGGG